MKCNKPVTDVELASIAHHLKDLFPTIDTLKLHKAYTSKVESYTRWESVHCIENHYLLMVRKCENFQCCTLFWLPNPLIDERWEHYKPNEELKNEDKSDEKNRLSLYLTKPRKAEKMMPQKTP